MLQAPNKCRRACTWQQVSLSYQVAKQRHINADGVHGQPSCKSSSPVQVTAAFSWTEFTTMHTSHSYEEHMDCPASLDPSLNVERNAATASGFQEPCGFSAALLYCTHSLVRSHPPRLDAVLVHFVTHAAAAPLVLQGAAGAC